MHLKKLNIPNLGVAADSKYRNIEVDCELVVHNGSFSFNVKVDHEARQAVRTQLLQGLTSAILDGQNVSIQATSITEDGVQLTVHAKVVDR
jgi:hypothetical protein